MLFPYEKINYLKERFNKKLVVIIDPTIAYRNYPTHQRGVQADIYQKDKNGKDAITKQWAGNVIFVNSGKNNRFYTP